MLASPDLASKRWIWEQYDTQVGNDTVQKPGGDAAVVRVHGTNKALAMTSDVTPRYCEADPHEGGKQAVAETWRNLTCVGAQPLAITNCLNFGNPQKPKIMGQLVGCIEGMAEACTALDYPVTGGNVSLYNETNGKGVQPTPTIGGVGILKDVSKHVGNALIAQPSSLILIGETKGHLGASLYLREILGREEGAPPPVNLMVEKKHGDFVRAQIQAGHVLACHDCSDGGLVVAVAEMCLAGSVGAAIALLPGDAAAIAFGEDQARYVLQVPEAMVFTVIEAAQEKGVPALRCGNVGGDALEVIGHFVEKVSELKALNEAWMPGFMQS